MRYAAGMSSIRVDPGLKEAPAQTSRNRWIIAPILLMAAAALGMALDAMHILGPGLPPQKIYSNLLLPLFRLLAYLGVGLLVGQIVETLGWTARLAQWVRPLTRWGHLKDESGAAFISSFVSGIVANTMLMGFYREEKLTRKELVLTYILNNGLPVYLVHLPTTLFVVSSSGGERRPSVSAHNFHRSLSEEPGRADIRPNYLSEALAEVERLDKSSGAW